MVFPRLNDVNCESRRWSCFRYGLPAVSATFLCASFEGHDSAFRSFIHLSRSQFIHFHRCIPPQLYVYIKMNDAHRFIQIGMVQFEKSMCRYLILVKIYYCVLVLVFQFYFNLYDKVFLSISEVSR